MLRICCLLLFCLLLAGCPLDKKALEAKARLQHAQLLSVLNGLPGAQIQDGETLLVSYPSGTLFSEASVLPLPGGTAQLEPLVNLLKQSGLRWQLKLRAATGEGADYDSQLAAGRAKILRRYLQAAGVDLKQITIMSLAESGPPLELSIIPPSREGS